MSRFGITIYGHQHSVNSRLAPLCNNKVTTDKDHLMNSFWRELTDQVALKLNCDESLPINQAIWIILFILCWWWWRVKDDDDERNSIIINDVMISVTAHTDKRDLTIIKTGASCRQSWKSDHDDVCSVIVDRWTDSVCPGLIFCWNLWPSATTSPKYWELAFQTRLNKLFRGVDREAFIYVQN